jgi:hypothetical protein
MSCHLFTGVLPYYYRPGTGSLSKLGVTLKSIPLYPPSFTKGRGIKERGVFTPLRHPVKEE